MKLRTSASSTPAPFLVSLLVAAMALVLVLAAQSWTTDRYHRAVTEEVLRDYASLAADEALRRIVQQVGYYGFEPAIAALRSTSTPDQPVPNVDAILSDAPQRTREAFELVDEVFWIDTFDWAVTGSVPTAFHEELVQRASAANLTDSSIKSVLLESNSSFGTFVFARASSASEETGHQGLVGFRIRDVALWAWCAKALARRPLLPQSLGEGNLDNTVLFLNVLNGKGQDVYLSEERYAGGLEVERQMPSDYVSVIEGLTVRAAIDPEAAHQLLIGGLPRSHLPVLLVLLVVTAGLLLSAIFLVRRERALINMRSDFVSRVSHELRTPLAQIRIFAETLRLGRVRSEEERAKYLNILEREAKRLTNLVENVLEFSRTDHSHRQLAIQKTEVAPMLERATEEMKPLVDARECRIATDSKRHLGALVDADAMHQALLNLIDNALKHGPKNQLIHLSAWECQDKILIAIDDQGPGIPITDRNSVWLPYHRSNATHQPGTGIGLAVVKELIEQQGGRCWIEDSSTSKDTGTRVVIELQQAQEDQ